MKKRLLITFMTILAVTCLAFGLAACADKPATKGLEYELNADGESYSVTGLGSATEEENIVIPSEHLKKPVTSVAAEAFYDCSSVKSVTIPKGVTSIGEDSFQNCVALTSVTIPDSVDSIGSFAFEGCEKLAEIKLPKGITTINGGVFANCNSLKSITVPDGVTLIEYRAFAGCSKLESVTIPASVTKISSSAFKDCTSLTAITLPEGVVQVSSSAFEGCTALKNITLPDSLTFIGGSAFEDTAFYDDETNWSRGVLYIGKHFITADGISGNYEITQGTINVAVYAFWSCDSLISVTIPSSVTSIGNNAFLKCEKLTDITFKGTKAQWNAVRKGDSWNGGVTVTVHCTDGDI